MSAAREVWFEGSIDLDSDRVVFVDETAAVSNMERRYGWAPHGQRCRISVPHGHYKTTTVTAALQGDGPFAVDLMDGATNGLRFRAYVADILVPALRSGNTVVTDNLAAHIRSPASANSAGRPEHVCSICRHTALCVTPAA